MTKQYHGTKELKLDFNNKTSFGAGTYVAYGCGFRYVLDNQQSKPYIIELPEINKESE